MSNKFQQYLKKVEQGIEIGRNVVSAGIDKIANFSSAPDITDLYGTTEQFPVNVPKSLDIGNHTVRFVKLLDEGVLFLCIVLHQKVVFHLFLL